MLDLIYLALGCTFFASFSFTRCFASGFKKTRRQAENKML